MKRAQFIPRSNPRRLSASFLAVALIFAFGTACAGAPTQDAGAPRIGKGDPTPEVKLGTKVKKSYESLPKDMSRVRGEQLQKLHADVDGLLRSCESYLTKHPKGSMRAEVLFIAARVKSLNLQRAMTEEIAQWKRLNGGGSPPPTFIPDTRQRLLAEVLAHLDEAFTFEKDDSVRCDLLKTKGLALWQASRMEEAAKIFRQVIQEFPNDSEADKNHVSLIAALLKAASRASRTGGANYMAVIEESQAFLAANPKSSYAPLVVSYQAKALRESGDIEGALRFWNENDNKVFSQDGRPDLARLIEQLHFDKGFLAFALGDSKQALAHMEKSLALLRDRQARGSITEVGKVYMTRTLRIIRVLKQLDGQQAGELDLEHWIDGQDLDIALERGNVVAILFSPYEWSRVHPFVQSIEAFYQKNWDDGFRAAMVCFAKGERDIPNQMAKVANERIGLGLTFPVGLDVDRDVYGLYDAAVGSSTIIVLDRSGKIAWYKMDPTERDIGVAGKVFERLLAQKSP